MPLFPLQSWYHRAEIGIAHADEALMLTLKRELTIASAPPSSFFDLFL
jgi:hypothetical protein